MILAGHLGKTLEEIDNMDNSEFQEWKTLNEHQLLGYPGDDMRTYYIMVSNGLDPKKVPQSEVFNSLDDKYWVKIDNPDSDLEKDDASATLSFIRRG